jgi:acyl-coenzyme A thioesterase PaaI-like protein
MLPENKEPILRVVPMPGDANQHGDIFGGWIMSQVDIAGGVLAARRALGRVATIAVNSPVQAAGYRDVLRSTATSCGGNTDHGVRGLRSAQPERHRPSR